MQPNDNPKHHPNADRLLAYAWNATHWIVWCDFCGKWHTHGYGPGHRVAHCGNESSPYYRYGYVLTGGVDPPADVRRQYNKQARRGARELKKILGLFAPRSDEF